MVGGRRGNRSGRASPPPYFLVTALTTMMLVTGMNILVPVLPGYARSFGVSATEVGLVVSAFAAGRLLLDLGGGALSDRLGPRAVCATGAAIIAGASVLGGLTDTFSLLLLARIVQGAGSALYMNAATLLVVSTLPEGQSGRWMSLYQGIFLTGLAVGPLLGGLVAELWGGAAPFYAYAVMAVIGLLLSLTRLPGKAALRDRGTEAGSSRTRRTAIRDLLRSRAFGISLLVILVMFIVRAGVRNTVIPLYAEEELGLSAGAVGALVTAAAVGQISVMWHAGAVIDTRGRRPVLVASLFAAAAGVLLLTVATTAPLLFAAMALLGLVTAYSTAAPTVVMVDVSDPGVRGTAIGIQRMVTDAGQLIGPIIVGLLLDHSSHLATLVIVGVLVLVTALATLSMPETQPDGSGQVSDSAGGGRAA